METLFYLSMAVNLILLSAIIFLLRHNAENKTPILKVPKTGFQPPQQAIRNQKLHNLAAVCEAKLPQEKRNSIKLLVEKDSPDLPAILQIGEIKISLKRNNVNRSLGEAKNIYEAVCYARNGYNGSGRYIPVPSEVDFVLAQKDIINVYLKALELEPISDKDKFWAVDTETGWNTGWKRFDWSVEKACQKLHNKFCIRTQTGYKKPNENESAKLFVLLKGWEHLFAEA